MKTVLFFFLAFNALILHAQINLSRQVEVLWLIDTYNGGDKNFEGVPYILIEEIYKDKIKAYDSSWHALSKQDIERNIPSEMRLPIFTLEECEILAANGVFSFIKDVETPYTEKQLKQLYAAGKPLAQLIQLKYYPGSQSRSWNLGILELVQLDSSIQEQRGKLQAIQLYIPAHYSETGKPRMLCQFYYEDVKKLHLWHQQLFDHHAFTTFIRRLEDLRIYDGDTTYQLAPLKNPINGSLEKSKIEHSIFRYFSGNIIFDEDREMLIGPKQSRYD